MYEVFDSFIKQSTWHSGGPADQKRFFQALDKAIRDPNFEPGPMGKSFAVKLGLDSLPPDHAYNKARDRYVDMAQTIWAFFHAYDGTEH